MDDARATLLGQRSATRARARVAGDLDAVVLMALRKEPERRYGTVEQFARDVRLHLEQQPVTARPDGVGYRLAKLVRRRRLETVAVALAMASLVGGLVVSTVQTRRAEAARLRATAVTKFLTTMLGAADPGSLGADVTVREVLDSAAVRADSLRDTPELESEVRTVIGSTYLAIGEFDAAQRQLELDLAARWRAFPKGNYAIGSAISRLSLAHEYSGRYAVSDSLLREAAAIFERFPPPDAVEAASVLEDRARVLVSLGRPAEAVPLLLEALAIQQRSGAVQDSAIAFTYTNAGLAFSDANDQVAADTMLRLAEQAGRRAFGDDHPMVASTMSLRASVFERLGRMAEADSTFRATLALRRRIIGADHPDYAWSLGNYADHLVRTERWAEAASTAREVLAMRGRTLDDGHPMVGTGLQVLGRALGRLDSLEAAERYLRESLALRRAAFPEGHWILASSENVLGEHYVLAGRYRDAEALLLPSERRLLELRGLRSPSVVSARERLVALYEAWGKQEDAARWRAALDSART
jgi:serine/threonine-protein kinase